MQRKIQAGLYIRRFPERIDGTETSFDFSNSVKQSSIADAIAYLKELYPDRVLTRDTLTKSNAERIFCSTRINGDTKIVLFASTEQRREIRAQLCVYDMRAPHLLDLAAGKIHPIKYTRDGERVYIDAVLYAVGSMALIFDSSIKTEELPMLGTSTGAAFTDRIPHGKKYEFTVETLPGVAMYAAIECAQNLDLITLNGEPLTPLCSFGGAEVYDPEVTYIDASFVRVPLHDVKPGENILRIEGKKVNNTNGSGGHNLIDSFNVCRCTELEAVYIVGNSAVKSCDNTDFSITVRRGELPARNITEDGFPFYAGKLQAEVSAKIHLTGGNVYLRLSVVEYELLICFAVRRNRQSKGGFFRN